MKKWAVRLFSNSLWDYYGEPEYFDTREEAENWVSKRKRLIAEHGLEAQIDEELIGT